MSDPFEITAFRCEQIAPFVDSSIDPAKRRDLLRRRVALTLPNGKKRRIPRSTPHRWINLYQGVGSRGLSPWLRAGTSMYHAVSLDRVVQAFGEESQRMLLWFDEAHNL